MKYPKLTFLITGFLMGALISYFAFNTADIYKERVTQLERELTQVEYQKHVLSESYKQLKSEFHENYRKIIKPDGTVIVERKTSKSESSSELNNTITQQSKTIKTLREKLKEVERRSERRNLAVSAGFNVDLDVVIGADYRVFPPFGIMGGITIDRDNPNIIKDLHIGVSFGF